MDRLLATHRPPRRRAIYTSKASNYMLAVIKLAINASQLVIIDTPLLVAVYLLVVIAVYTSS